MMMKQQRYKNVFEALVRRIWGMIRIKRGKWRWDKATDS